jgi:hypothetical protein
MQLYAGSSRDFITDATRNQIAGKLKSAFVESYHSRPSPQEVQSWQNSLLQMAVVLQSGGLDDRGILLEYQLPLSPSEDETTGLSWRPGGATDRSHLRYDRS